MFKTLLLFSMAFILSSCASINSNPVSLQAETNPAAAQASVTPAQAPTETGAEPGGAGDGIGSGETASEVEVALENGTMEEVEVEGFKEEEICTYEARTGSRIKKKYCRTVIDNTNQREASRKWIDTIKRSAQGSHVKG